MELSSMFLLNMTLEPLSFSNGIELSLCEIAYIIERYVEFETMAKPDFRLWDLQPVFWSECMAHFGRHWFSGETSLERRVERISGAMNFMHDLLSEEGYTREMEPGIRVPAPPPATLSPSVRSLPFIHRGGSGPEGVSVRGPVERVEASSRSSRGPAKRTRKVLEKAILQDPTDIQVTCADDPLGLLVINMALGKGNTLLNDPEFRDPDGLSPSGYSIPREILDRIALSGAGVWGGGVRAPGGAAAAAKRIQDPHCVMEGVMRDSLPLWTQISPDLGNLYKLMLWHRALLSRCAEAVRAFCSWIEQPTVESDSFCVVPAIMKPYYEAVSSHLTLAVAARSSGTGSSCRASLLALSMLTVPLRTVHRTAVPAVWLPICRWTHVLPCSPTDSPSSVFTTMARMAEALTAEDRYTDAVVRASADPQLASLPAVAALRNGMVWQYLTPRDVTGVSCPCCRMPKPDETACREIHGTRPLRSDGESPRDVLNIQAFPFFAVDYFRLLQESHRIVPRVAFFEACQAILLENLHPSPTEYHAQNRLLLDAEAQTVSVMTLVEAVACLGASRVSPLLGTDVGNVFTIVFGVEPLDSTSDPSGLAGMACGMLICLNGRDRAADPGGSRVFYMMRNGPLHTMLCASMHPAHQPGRFRPPEADIPVNGHHPLRHIQLHVK